jgi:hypothetical protein
MSLITPLIQAPIIIPQLILSLCTISIATCNKRFEIMTPFNGDKIRARLAVRAGNKTFSWLFNTGAAVTCMKKESFDLAFGHSKPKQISKLQSCVAASRDKMFFCGVFEVDLFIKGKKFTHPVNVIQELNENIIGIDFIHSHKLTYEIISCRVKFAGSGTNSNVALKNTVLLAMTSTIIKTKFKGQCNAQATDIANISAPRMPMDLGMPSSSTWTRTTSAA